MRRRFVAPALAFAAGWLWPAVALACPVCFSGSARVRMAFFGTTILLSLVPLGMIAAGLVWLHRSGRLSWHDEFEDRDAYTPPVVEAEGRRAKRARATRTAVPRSG